MAGVARDEADHAETRAHGATYVSLFRISATSWSGFVQFSNRRRNHMAVMTTEKSAAIRPFTFETPEADLVDLRARIAATRWPEKETVDDPSQGVQLATIQALARYWETEYD